MNLLSFGHGYSARALAPHLLDRGWQRLLDTKARSLVLFAGTIGELNAVRTFIDRCRRTWPETG